ncbi:leucine-rich repeat-containing protein 18 [Anabas testudineus]|uniref:Disease resistance R13L4/SHOC-2-like LRR domain-containing protein n=1 Tax=Anabas testudineus TaxID=64144 RepID=A0A3Q1JPA4_ANATE|nr:leucine-rich repeat-containing protein 18 [Anabas testudineus]XP_033182245.1 leucine-rich repeat-containing protein 18 [Anabas testudineus]XP_033182246.1 leucine-rich repeat-containing protein 18 [Anabas testudineus]XP_033182247.1 leucine-rich repeat-containing protein 18 [Anabas testudineus]XP_033182248.1 leucine-rich repeat-containing protein 18 [Anabas testudineus]
MPKGKAAKGTKVTLKIAKKAVRMTPDGRRRLTLSNMGIIIFPKCIFKLTNVDELDLSRNQIQKLPDNIGNFSSLRWLDLHSNKLESVPESIGNLVGLTHLNLANNRLTSAGLPDTLGLLTSLKSLNLGMNQLDSLPTTMMALDSLQELGLFDNLFINLPEFLKVLCNLTKVNMKQNPLSYIQGDGEGMLDDKCDPEEGVYLVHESSLCRTCLKRCKDQGERLKRGGGKGGTRGGGGGDAFEEKRIRTYPGLIAPNSVATVSQDVWRIRKVEHGAADIIFTNYKTN